VNCFGNSTKSDQSPCLWWLWPAQQPELCSLWEARYSLTRFGAKSLLPAAIVFSVIHETGPIITGLVVSGRVGAGIGAELASMKVTEQIDAIEASAVNPYRLLAATRILACILMLPLLTLAGDACW
jgi:phospholipid/cholesterol/gamma-HCH transport system permease protein